MKLKRQPVTEADDEETGKHTCWATIVRDPYYSFVWITKTDDGYAVDIDRDSSFIIIARCKSLISAKRWVTMNLTIVSEDSPPSKQ